MEGELKMDIRSIRHNCRLLYHLTQIPIRCLSPDSSICFTFPHLEGMERFCDLWNALNTLPETQGLRIDACIIEGKSMTEVAEADGVSVAAVHKSIQQGLKSMKKYLQNV